MMIGVVSLAFAASAYSTGLAFSHPFLGIDGSRLRRCLQLLSRRCQLLCAIIVVVLIHEGSVALPDHATCAECLDLRWSLTGSGHQITDPL